jgi:hypothetical protein
MPLLIIALLLLLLALHNFSIVLVTLPISVLVLIVAKYQAKLNNINIAGVLRENRIVFAFIFIVLFAIVRTNRLSSSIFTVLYHVTILCLLIGSFIFFYTHYILKNKDKYTNLFLPILIPYFLLAVINWIFYFLGFETVNSAFVEGKSETPSLILSLLGFASTRIEFPLVGGLNNYAIYLGALLSVAFLLKFEDKKLKFFKQVLIVLFFITILVIDSRASLLFPVIILLIVNLLKRNRWIPSGFKWLSILVVLGPFIYLILLPWLGTMEFLSFLSRKDNDLATGNYRFFIWGICMEHFSTFELVHLIGYGDFGHLGSGAASKWSVGKLYKRAMSPHNMFYAVLFDFGYIGVSLFVAIYWSVFRKIGKLWRNYPRIAYPSFAFFIYTVLSGFTESVGIYYQLNFFMLFFMLVITMNIFYYFAKKGVISSHKY